MLSRMRRVVFSTINARLPGKDNSKVPINKSGSKLEPWLQPPVGGFDAAGEQQSNGGQSGHLNERTASGRPAEFELKPGHSAVRQSWKQ